MSASIAIIGGTGKEGRGLAARWARAGHRVLVGSRDPDRARQAAADLAELVGAGVEGGGNADVAAGAEIVVLATPFEGVLDTVGGFEGALAGKLVVSAVVPMRFVDGRPLIDEVPEGSAAQAVAARLPRSRVAAAFHTVSAKSLLDIDHALDEDVAIVADDQADREVVLGLCADIGARGVVAGPLSLAHYVECQTAVLASLNKLNRTQSGLRFTGLP
ncbi:MAG TPA: NADPH-dependent F420 reductase [Candidatus Dormibacteraeota bacterium]|nr:NADPH-dependent F420 reductase [Candidatus Dormibacteraeota bacterium]